MIMTIEDKLKIADEIIQRLSASRRIYEYKIVEVHVIDKLIDEYYGETYKDD